MKDKKVHKTTERTDTLHNREMVRRAYYECLLEDFTKRPTQEDISKKCNLSVRTVHTHLQEVYKHYGIGGKGWNKDIARVMYAILRKAVNKGDTAAMKLFLQVAGGYREGMDINADVKHNNLLDVFNAFSKDVDKNGDTKPIDEHLDDKEK